MGDERIESTARPTLRLIAFHPLYLSAHRFAEDYHLNSILCFAFHFSIFTFHHQRLDGLGGGCVVAPMGGLLLLEEPLLHESDGLAVVGRYLGEGLDKQGLRLNGTLIPAPATLVVAPIHAHLVAGERFLHDAAQQVMGLLLVTVSVEDKGQLGLRIEVCKLFVALQGIGIIVFVGLGLRLAI